MKKEDFIGKTAHLSHRTKNPVALLCTFTIGAESLDGAKGAERRFPLGNEVILTTDGERIVDATGRPSYLTSTGSGPSVGSQLGLGYLPFDLAVEGNVFAVQCMGRLYPATVAVVGNGSIFDPTNERLKG